MTSTDIELRVIGGALLPANQGGKQLPLGDGVDQNDKPFRSTFPYVATPHGRVQRHRQADGAGARAGPAAAGLTPHARPRRLFGRRPQTFATAPSPVFTASASRRDRAFARQRRARPPRRRRSAPSPSAPEAAPTRHRPPADRRARRPGPTARAALAAAYLQKVRETGDAGFYTRADGAAAPGAGPRAARRRRLVRAATLAAARHDFRGALRLARRAAAAGPARSPRCRSPSTRWSSSGATAPPSARCSARRPQAEPLRLRAGLLLPRAERRPRRRDRGDAARRLRGRPGAGERRLRAGLLGELELARGRLGRGAARLPTRRSRACPATPPAAAGRARLAAARRPARRGRPLAARRGAAAAARVRDRARRDRAGRGPHRRRRGATSRSCAREQKLLAGAGVNTDVELAIFEADHGSPARGVALARRAWASAPSVRSADALGWALARPGDARGGPALGAPRAAARLARPARSATTRHDRARRRPPRRGARGPALGARARARPQPLHLQRARGRCDEARRSWLALLVLAALPAAAASAHPLGNFSVNHLARCRSRGPRRRALRPRPGRDPDVPGARRRRTRGARAQAGRGARRLVLTVDGRPCRAAPAAGAPIAHPPARAGCGRRASSSRWPPRSRRRARVACATGRSRAASAGRRSSPRPGRGHRGALDVPASDPTGGLRALPAGPARAARPTCAWRRFAVRPAPARSRRPTARRVGGRRRAARGDGFAARSATPRPARACSLLLLLAAFGWGALHALSPGHGKAMVAAYLVGTRGTRAPRGRARRDRDHHPHRGRLRARAGHARRCPQYVLPEDLYPWLNLVSGLLVLVVGADVLRKHLRAAAHASTITTTTTTATTTARTASTSLRRADPGDGRGRRPDPVPVGARRAARRRRPGPDRARDAADRRLQRSAWRPR